VSNINPKITVITPVFNSEKYIEQTIQSIYNQNYFPLQIIVVDDGSYDNTAKIVQSHSNILYFYQENSGPAAARNLALKYATGEFITFLDSDDLWNENALHQLSSFLQENKDVDIVEGKLQEVVSNHNLNDIVQISEPYYMSNFGSCMIRKAVFDIVGNYNSQLKYAEDIDWFTRAWENNIHKLRVPETILYYRKHQDNLTKNHLGNPYFYRLLLFKLKIERENNRTYTPIGNLNDYIGDRKMKSQ
jgi:glycosyltransferase involved in cell wall biosynthesis